MRQIPGTAPYSYDSIKKMALRWEWIMEDYDYPSRRKAMRVLYQMILSWMDGDGSHESTSQELYELFLSGFARDVCRWLMEYPKVETYCPTLVRMGLNTPELIEEALKE